MVNKRDDDEIDNYEKEEQTKNIKICAQTFIKVLWETCVINKKGRI